MNVHVYLYIYICEFLHLLQIFVYEFICKLVGYICCCQQIVLGGTQDREYYILCVYICVSVYLYLVCLNLCICVFGTYIFVNEFIRKLV